MVIRERAAALRRLGETKNAAFGRRFIGEVLEVVVEKGKKEGLCRGMSRNYLTVLFPGLAGEGEVVPVRVTAWTAAGLRGEVA